jgi:kynurenine formamidase
MTTYPGLPGPSVMTHVSREQSAQRLEGGASFHIGRIDMVANTGTYLDAPYHFHESGADVSQIPVEQLVALPCVVVDASGTRAIPPEVLPHDIDLRDAAVLFRTNWSSRWRTPAYAVGSPYLTRDTVTRLREAAPALVGIDALNVDAVEDLSRPAHHGLLGDGILIVEHMTNLDIVPATGARFTALPAPVAGMGTMPVRAVAVLPDTPA